MSSAEDNSPDVETTFQLIYGRYLDCLMKFLSSSKKEEMLKKLVFY